MSPTQPAAYDVRTTEHDQIRAWVEDRDGHPVEIQDAADDEITVEFGEVDEAVHMPLDWPAFFERFDRQGYVFAYQESPDGDPGDAWAFFEETRIEQSNRLGEEETDQSTGGPLDDEEMDEDPGSDPDHVGDGRSQPRHEEATDQENADNHRDEEPFES